MVTLGIDIGATKTAVGLFEGKMLAHAGVTSTGDFESTMNGIGAKVREWGSNPGIRAVGVACTGPFDTESGVVLNDTTLHGWYGKSIPVAIRTMFDAPTTLINDADAAILGEVFEGSNGLDEADSALLLTFGTGIGGAFWDGKGVYAGAYGEHPEIGHIGVDPNGPQCYCGLRGCLESLGSGPAIEGFARELGIDGIERLDAEIEAENQAAIDLADRTRMAITYALVTLTHCFRPSCFILGGGVMEKLGRHLAPSQVPVNASTVPASPPGIVLASLGNRAGMYGANVAARKSIHDY